MANGSERSAAQLWLVWEELVVWPAVSFSGMLLELLTLNAQNADMTQGPRQARLPPRSVRLYCVLPSYYNRRLPHHSEVLDPKQASRSW